MTNDLIVVVPPGTRVRYCHSEHVDRMYAIDAHALEHHHFDYPPPAMFGGSLSDLSGIPVYDAEPYDTPQEPA